MEKPKQLENVDLEALRELCQQYIDFLCDKEEYTEDNDFDHYIFEAAISALYGDNVWEFINNKLT